MNKAPSAFPRRGAENTPFCCTTTKAIDGPQFRVMVRAVSSGTEAFDIIKLTMQCKCDLHESAGIEEDPTVSTNVGIIK